MTSTNPSSRHRRQPSIHLRLDTKAHVASPATPIFGIPTPAHVTKHRPRSTDPPATITPALFTAHYPAYRARHRLGRKPFNIVPRKGRLSLSAVKPDKIAEKKGWVRETREVKKERFPSISASGKSDSASDAARRHRSRSRHRSLRTPSRSADAGAEKGMKRASTVSGSSTQVCPECKKSYWMCWCFTERKLKKVMSAPVVTAALGSPRFV